MNMQERFWALALKATLIARLALNVVRDSGVVIVLASLLVGLLRFTVPGHGFSWPGTYEAFAHILVGALLVLSFQRDRLALGLLIGLTVLETVCFLMR